MKVKNDHRSKSSNLSNSKEEAWKNQGFDGIRTRDLRVTGALLYQLSYEATHWERGQFIEFISPVRSEMRWSIYEIFHFSFFELRLYMKVKNDHRSKFSNLSNWKEEAWKNQSFNGIRTCDLHDTGAMLYQLSYETTHWERVRQWSCELL